MPFRATRLALLAVLASPILVSPILAQTALPSLSDPTISPDGREIAFVSGGDIWSVPRGRRRSPPPRHPSATESRPLYSPDGKKLAFMSTRTGAGNIYVLTLATGELQAPHLRRHSRPP